MLIETHNYLVTMKAWSRMWRMHSWRDWKWTLSHTSWIVQAIS